MHTATCPRLADFRRAAGLTQQDVADRLGRHLMTVWRWDNGEVVPPLRVLSVLADLYGCKVTDLIDD